LRAQTGLVFLTYRASRSIDAVTARVVARAPLYDFVAPDGVAHTTWRVPPAEEAALVAAYADLETLYIADGHHRAASAARARAVLEPAGHPPGAAARFAAVAFPDREVQILPYHRVVRDLFGLTADELIARLRERMTVRDTSPVPRRSGEVSMYLAG